MERDLCNFVISFYVMVNVYGRTTGRCERSEKSFTPFLSKTEKISSNFGGFVVMLPGITRIPVGGGCCFGPRG